jgi:hypothetical protein
LEGLENILKVGDQDAKATGSHNMMATYIAEADGLNKIEELQHHSNNDIYDKAIKLLETYFGVEEEEEMPALAPTMEGNQFTFSAPGQMDGVQQNFDFSS